MAFVTEFLSSPAQGTSREHSTCTAGWRSTTRGASKVLQIDTYGSAERKDSGTVSQSLQVDEAGARELVDIIRQVFPSAVR